MSKRAQDIMALLKSALQIEFPSFILTEGSSSGNPTLQIAADATPATTEEVAFLRIVPRSYVGFPTISLASTDDGRSSVIEIAFESLAAPNTNKTVWSSINLSKLISRIKDMNTDILVYQKANGAIPDETDIASGNFKGEIRADARHPNIGQ